jgi:hypothetical protein
MVNKYYAGVGSRETPLDILNLMTRIARKLEFNNFVLRSGGAIGADSAFERGVKNNCNKKIFVAADATEPAIQLASTIHPAWHRCTDYARKLHGRNCMQILGENLDTPVKFVICWTRNAQTIGGTATAIRLAKQRGIKVYNLANAAVRELFVEWVNK